MSDSKLKKTINITVEGAYTLPLKELTPFQGDLKYLDKTAYERMKKTLIDFGFSFVVHVWKSKEKYYIIDGHQRIATITQMETEGWVIPELPIALIQADSFAEAKRKVLAAASQYGKITKDSLATYIIENDIPLDEIVTTFSFPEVDYTTIVEQFESTIAEESPTPSSTSNNHNPWSGMPEFNQEDKTSVRQLIVHFKTQEDAEKFSELVGQTLTEKTRSIWFPKAEIETMMDKRYATE